MAHKLALIGFGTVGQALTEILRDKGRVLEEQEGFQGVITAVSDPLKGSLHHPDGLDPARLLEAVEREGNLSAYPDTPGLVRGWDSLTTIREALADTVVEVSYTDVETGQPAINHCRSAFESGKNVVMTNKGPAALAFEELSSLADRKGVKWGYEGTVMSGTPALRMPSTALAGNDIYEVRGILNGTTNYILTRMETGESLEESLAKAQQQGMAEADPSSDLDGHDVLYKIMILARVVMNHPLARGEVAREGIRHLTVEDILQAKEEGKCWKLVGRIRKEQGGVRASVGPEKLPLSDPLAGVSGALNAITYDCDLLGSVTLIGAGAGRKETGFALLNDLIHVVRGGS
ncbi:homoserine dehydrogenase [Salinithrix halophila]|uniref:Homoserine dehydrogenase n=1 Tax=Salinithrix halophila TaxID=1485204 RepID=A0ABV8JD21_9BACL